MSNQERKLNELKKAVPTEKGDTFDVEIPEKDLDAVSGGMANESDIAPAGDLCMCKCGTASTCGGGGGG